MKPSRRAQLFVGKYFDKLPFFQSNLLFNTDTQQELAASRQMLCAG